MRHRLLLGWMLVAACLVVAAPVGADERSPATLPTSRPAADLASIRHLLAQLASDNFGVRESARIALMGLDRADLPTLREAVKQSLPLEPSQAIVLRDIVTQAYLSGDPYDKAQGSQGFLGISLPNSMRVEDRGML